jgi:hypothetical protein
MVAKAPIYAYLIWFAIMFSPFFLVAIPLALHLNGFFYFATLIPASAGARYIYLALIRHTRRRVLQSLMRAKALKEDKPFILISRSYDQSKKFVTLTPINAPGAPSGELALFEALIYDLSHKHPIVVMGDKDLHPDDPAGRALYISAWPDDAGQQPYCLSWEDMFVRLAHAARHVLVIPADSQGVRSELELPAEASFGCQNSSLHVAGKRLSPIHGDQRQWPSLGILERFVGHIWV